MGTDAAEDARSRGLPGSAPCSASSAEPWLDFPRRQVFYGVNLAHSAACATFAAVGLTLALVGPL